MNKHNNISNIISKYAWWDIYYVLTVLCYISTLFSDAMRPGVAGCVLMLLIAGEFIVRNRSNIRPSAVKSLNLIDWLVFSYVVYNLLSVIWLIKSGMPVNVFVEECAVSLVPVLFYAVGRTPLEREGSFYKVFLIAYGILAIASLLLYVIGPQFYADFLYKWSHISKADIPTMRVRMESVTGSTIFGALSVYAMAAGAFIMLEGPASNTIHGEKNITDTETGDSRKLGRRSTFIGIVCMAAGFAFACLSSQRSAMVVAFLVVLYVNWLIFFVQRTVPKKYFIVECIAIAVAFAALLVVAPNLVMKVYYRVESLPLAVGERSEQWVAAVNAMYSSWIGNGLGANGHKALGIPDAKVIADGGLVKMFCELGVIGFSIFVYIMILIFTKGVKHIGKCYAELGIIAVTLLQCIGSDTLSFQMCAPMFWYAVGRSTSWIYYESGDERAARTSDAAIDGITGTKENDAAADVMADVKEDDTEIRAEEHV